MFAFSINADDYDGSTAQLISTLRMADHRALEYKKH
jgi:hypothetical protein